MSLESPNQVDSKKDSHWITKSLERKTLTAFILAISIFGASLLALKMIPIEIMPRENTPPLILVRINFENADEPENNEIRLVETIEGQLKSVSHVRRQRSTVDSKGVSISLNLDPGTDLDLIDVEITENLENLSSVGLFKMKNVSLMRMNPESSATMKLALQKVGSEKLNVQKLQTEIQTLLEAVSGVAKIDISGLEPTKAEMKIAFNKLKQLRIAPTAIAQALQFPQQVSTIGAMEAGSHLTTLAAIPAELQLSEILKYPINLKTGLQLSELAPLEISNKMDTEVLHLNGNAAFMIEIYPKFGANLFELGQDVEKNIAYWNQSLNGKNTQLSIVYNLVDELSLSIQDVIDSLMQAMLITFFVVLFFYRRIDLILIINLSIPLCLLLTVGALYFLGKSLNLLTLSGLILSIGVVVDNAALVLERTDEILRETNLSIKSAVGHAAQEVIGPLSLSSLTNALIFVPLLFIDDSDSFMALLKAFQIPIIGSLVASLLIAVLFVPLIRIITPIPKKQETEAPPKESNPLLAYIYKHKFIFGAFSVMAFIGTLDIIKMLDSSDLATPRDPYAQINVKFSPEINPDQRKLKILEIERDLNDNKKILKYKSLVTDFQPQQLQGSFTFFVESSTDRDETLSSLEKRLSAWLHKRPLEIGLALNLSFDSQYGTILQNNFSISFQAKNSLQFEKFFQSMIPVFLQTASLEKFQLDKEANASYQLALLPRGEILSTYRIQPSLAAQTIQAALGSTSTENIEHQSERISLKTQIIPDTNEKWRREQIENLNITMGDREVPIGQLFDFAQIPSSQVINRQDRKSLQKIHFTVKDPSQLDSTRQMVNQYFANLIENTSQNLVRSQFPGISLEKNTSIQNIEEMEKKTFFILGLSILLIYLVLAAIFESLFIPLSVIVSIPVALSFGAVGLWIMKIELDVMARLGLVMLVGICVNNAIILIDLILNLRKFGYSRKESVIIGCSRRLRAVLMTTVIQVLSVLPVAFGQGKLMGIPYASLGIVIISGMVFSTIILFTLLPVSYELFDDLENKFSKKHRAS